MVNIPKVDAADEFEPLTLRPGERIFVLTGAGISAESGVRTFRDAGGLWEDHRIEDVATPEGWQRNPGLVWRFYSERRRQLQHARPNLGHVALAELAQYPDLGDLFLCTQNVDDLHERAGSKDVCHMHGELFSTRCAHCSRKPFRDETLHLELLPRCEECRGRLRPDIVWFGEMPMHLDRIGEAVSNCDLFITVGSSGSVYPAAGLVSHVREHPSPRTGLHARTLYIGPEEPENAHAFDECRLGKAGEVLPTLFSRPT